MTIRQIIESKIKASGMTKKEAAARAGIHSGNINGMIAAPSWPTLERLAAALGVSVSELIRDPANDDSSSPAPVVGAVCPHCGRALVIVAANDDSSPAPASMEEEPPQR